MPGVRMYAEWASLAGRLRSSQEPSASVLHSFPPGVGRDVALSTINHVARSHGVNIPGSDMGTESSFLHSDKDVRWTMEVVCYGLSLPLTEHETIKYCVHVYCDWLTSLMPNPKNCVPTPLLAAPELYCRQMINQLYNVFMPRAGENADQVHKQAVLCHRILRTLQAVARDSTVMTLELWEELLLVLLSINDTLLAPPYEKGLSFLISESRCFESYDMGDLLGERVLSVLFEVWLLGSLKSFPSPVLWKTFSEVTQRWRHRAAVIDQWNRVCLALTVRLLSDMYGQQLVLATVDIREEDLHLVPAAMSKETVKQAWYRMLHLLGNPVELSQVGLISNAPHFKHWAIVQENPKEPCEHPCLSVLPDAFTRAMAGVSAMVDAFLASRGGPASSSAVRSLMDTSAFGSTASVSSASSAESHPIFPNYAEAKMRLSSRRPRAATFDLGTSISSGPTGASSSSTLTSSTGSGGSGSTIVASSEGPSQPYLPPQRGTIALLPGRPRVNSILHLFGAWLFEASLVGSTLVSSSVVQNTSNTGRPKSMMGEPEERMDLPDSVTADKFERGRALALGTLCRIFCAKRTHEDIQPIYLSHFYVALNQGLAPPGKAASSEVIASVLMNGQDLLRVDLDGVQVILPEIVAAIEIVLSSDKDSKFRPKSNIPVAELRRAAISILLSALALPQHFLNLPINRLFSYSGGRSGHNRPGNFLELRPRLLNVLTHALQYEADPLNTAMLLGGLSMSVQDAALFETAIQSSQLEIALNETGYSNASSSAPSSLQSSDFSRRDDESPYSSLGNSEYSATDSAKTMFSKATYWVCQRLKKHWFSNLNVCLAALEALGGLSQIRLQDFRIGEARTPVLALCNFIVNQCSRPKQAHSRDLHSSIVAAFRCLQMWLLHYPGLLTSDPRGTLYAILETIELGLSGSKSIENPGDIPIMKEDKPCNPTSMRVKEAAEAVYSHIFNHVGLLQREIGAESLSSQLDEETLLMHSNVWHPARDRKSAGDGFVSKAQAAKHFRYFALDNSTLLALLEQPMGNDQDAQPSITALIRGPFGRFAWTMQLKSLPRNKSGSKALLASSNPGRPLPASDMGPSGPYNPRFEPEDVERVTPCKVDKSIPSLESLSSRQNSRVCSTFETILKEQIQMEDAVFADKRGYEREYPNPETECLPPTLCTEFQTARIFLSSFQMLSPHLGVEDPQRRIVGEQHPPLCALNAADAAFLQELEMLDRMEARTHDTLHVFYVGAGQRDLSDFLQNVETLENTSKEFVEFLLSVGWPVKIAKHSGWTGDVNTSWHGGAHVKHSEVPTRRAKDRGDTIGSKQTVPRHWDGSTEVLYWSDASQEVAVVVPSVRNLEESVTARLSSDALSKPSGLTGESTSESSLNTGPMQRRLNPVTKVIVAWIETQEDAATLPIGDMVNVCRTGEEPSAYWQETPDKRPVFLICIHPQQTGLFRIRLKSNAMPRSSFAVPMVDGMVVSRRSLGALVRQMALNAYHRQRLEHDGFRQPHVQRTLKIQDIVKKFQCKTTLPEFYCNLFTNPA